MKALIIHKSKKKVLIYLVLSTVLLGFIVYLFATGEMKYSKGNSFYWIGIVLIGLVTLYFIYDFIDKTPLYKITSEGIYKGHNNKGILWTSLSTFECKTIYGRYVSSKIAILYNKEGNEVFTIDITFTDISLERLEKILKIKLRQKGC
ncbi:MAG: hypothetical protein WDN26_05015 [Chitinophagaceae bacterium]